MVLPARSGVSSGHPAPPTGQRHARTKVGVGTSGGRRLHQTRDSLTVRQETLRVTPLGGHVAHKRAGPGLPPGTLLVLARTCGALGLGDVLGLPFPRLDTFFLHRQGPGHLAGTGRRVAGPSPCSPLEPPAVPPALVSALRATCPPGRAGRAASHSLPEPSGQGGGSGWTQDWVSAEG